MSTLEHESAKYHVTGEAVFIDDMLVNKELLHGHVVYSPHAHAKIVSYNLAEAKNVKGVHCILSYKDIPGENQMGPVIRDELVLASGKVTFIGQAIFLIAADTEEIARTAEKLITIEYKQLKPILSIVDAIKSGRLIQPKRKIENGNIKKAFNSAPNIIEGELKTGAQEQWYLETQVALAYPGEGVELLVHSSTQHPSETQAIVSEVLRIPKNEIEVQVRRMGGAFGGKETQANHVAVWASLLAFQTRRPVKIRLFRDDDQKMTGKRHPFLTYYKAAFNNKGLIMGLDLEQHTDAGAATDLTMAILERAMMHADNAYYIPNIRIMGFAWFTNLPSNTAFRGFGGPQGMACIETIIDKIARQLKKDPAEIRNINFYGGEGRSETPYGQIIEHNRLNIIEEQLMLSSRYIERRDLVKQFNEKSEFIKRGIAITPVKFGISFTTSFLNQAGALVHVYKDGTVLVNHGGTEMGQGLHTKIQQIASLEFGVSAQKIKVNATSTAKVPNTSATAASAGTDLNGMAVKDAIFKLKASIALLVAEEFNNNIPTSQPETDDEDIIFVNDNIYDIENTTRKISFEDAINLAYINQVSLSATGFYKTPDIHFDREKGKGHPYFYYSFGMAVTEIELDTLTGFFQNLRTDILHDVGESLNRRLDIGQIEGGYVQGQGWCTTEECKWDDKGNLLNHSPDTYKIPNIQDIPKDFRVQLLEDFPNSVNTIRRSKAIAEPPLMLAFSCWLAIKDAISAVGNHEIEPEFSLPATNEVILLSIDKIREQLN
ncbi:MAG TPA: xanthine dehydrogenase molybdopterin binding subunit [Flavobacteriales bacterium]|nr:xanthine dehydrogenase molybdopterin binding subunit [Flavobacteriales bacterium]